MKWSKAMLVEGKETLLGVEKGVFLFTRRFFPNSEKLGVLYG